MLRWTGVSPELRVAGELSPPGRECWPELGATVDAVLPRTEARRRRDFRALACSGEGTACRSWCFPPVNGPSPELRFPVICSSPVSECWPEVGASAEYALRRTRARRRWECRALACSGVGTARRSWRFPPVSALLTGVGIPVIISPPAVECWPELGADAVFRGTGARRRW